MQLPTIFLPLLAFFTSSTVACASYANCKCHDAATQLQNNDVTAKACAKYQTDKHAELTYSNTPHHQCVGSLLVGTDAVATMDNCAWDDVCKSFGNYYQVY